MNFLSSLYKNSGNWGHAGAAVRAPRLVRAAHLLRFQAEGDISAVLGDIAQLRPILEQLEPAKAYVAVNAVGAVRTCCTFRTETRVNRAASEQSSE